jgi:hypothetical protein
VAIGPVPAQFGKAAAAAGSVTYAMPLDVSVGDLIAVSCSLYGNIGGSLAAGDLTKVAGTATIDTPILHVQRSTAANEAHGGIWTVLVTGAGSLTLQLAPGGSYTTMFVGVFTGNFDADREEDTNSNGTTTDNQNSHTSGNATSAGPALFLGFLAVDDDNTTTLGVDASFTQIAEEESGANFMPGNFAYRIVGSGTTVNYNSTSTGANYGWVSGIVALREAAGGEVVSVSVSAAGELGVAFSGKVAANASMTAGFGAGTADGSVADAVASVAIPADLALAAAALRQASGAIAAGQSLGEAWAAQAAAAALLAVSGELGAEFTATSSASEEAAVTAGTEASASFLAAAQAFGQLIPGATVGDLFVGIAQARGSVDASSSLSYVAAASVAMQVSIETGLELGEAWASHASVMADMASAGEFGISFTAETQAAQSGAFAAGTVAAAQFLSSISALGALVGAASFGMALQSVATADADLEVVAYLGAAFGIGDMPPTPPIPPGRTVTVLARSRLIRIPSRSRTIRVH